MNELLSRIEELKAIGIEAKKMFPEISDVTLREKWPVLSDMELASYPFGLDVLPQTGTPILLFTDPNEGITISIIHDKKNS